MTVEVKIIPEGTSGLKKTGNKDQSKEQLIKVPPSYHQKASSAITRMLADTKREHTRVRPRTIRRMMLKQLQAGDPTAPIAVLEELIEKLLPTVMERYKGPAIEKPVISDEVRRVWEARDAERRRVVKANKLRRKMDQPLSAADRAWIERGLR